MASATDVSNIGSIHSWYRGDGITPTTNGSAITSWADRGSSGYSATNTTTSERPTYATSPFASASFDASRKFLGSNSSASLTTQTVFMVVRPSDSGDYRSIIGCAGAEDAGGHNVYLNNGRPILARQGIADVVAGTNSVPANVNGVLTLQYSSVSACFYINGTVDSTVETSPIAPSASQTLRIGSGYNGGDNFAGNIFEIITFSKVLSASERAIVHSYISDRYAITVSDYVATGTDTVAPSVPSNVTTTANSATSVTVSWTASTDAFGVSNYRIRRGGTDLSGATALTGTSYTDATVVASTSYSYTVSAVDAASNRSAESTAVTVTTPPGTAGGTGTANKILSRWNGSSLATQITSMWTGSSLATKVIDLIAVVNPVTPIGTSTPARWWIPNGGTPDVRATWETGVNSDGKAQVVWIGSFPDVRARTTKLETGVAASAQDAFQAYIQDTTTNTIVADSGITTGTAEKWVASSFTPVAGRVYKGFARVRAVSGTWSPYTSTRFVAPSGRILYLEDYGAVGNGTTRSGNDYSNSIYSGPIGNALKAAQPGDVVKSKAPGTVLTGVTATGNQLSSSSAIFTSSMAGKKVIIYGAGTKDSTSNSYAFRTTISSVASDLKSATLAASVLTNGTNLRIIVNYAEYWTGHIDVDGGLGSPGSGGGWTLDGTGCIFTSLDVDSSGFRTTIQDVTYKNVHYWQKTQTTRGNGLNNNTGPFFIEGTGATGIRLIGCYAERARDAGFLIYGGPSDIHVVDCVADHTNADGFHVTGSANNVQFIRPLNVWIGDDAIANIGYRSDGDAARPFNIIWENPKLLGQDWGRGVSFGGCYHCLVTDLYMERGAGTSFILGSDGDMANTSDVQMRRGAIVSPNVRRDQKPTYSQGSGTGSIISDEPWIKLLNSSSSTRQRDILMEDITITDGRYIQIISYGNGEFQDGTVILRGLTMQGATNSGTTWLDQGTYSNHVDFRGISVPSGSIAISAPTGSNS